MILLNSSKAKVNQRGSMKESKETIGKTGLSKKYREEKSSKEIDHILSNPLPSADPPKIASGNYSFILHLAELILLQRDIILRIF